MCSGDNTMLLSTAYFLNEKLQIIGNIDVLQCPYTA